MYKLGTPQKNSTRPVLRKIIRLKKTRIYYTYKYKYKIINITYSFNNVGGINKLINVEQSNTIIIIMRSLV